MCLPIPPIAGVINDLSATRDSNPEGLSTVGYPNFLIGTFYALDDIIYFNRYFDLALSADFSAAFFFL